MIDDEDEVDLFRDQLKIQADEIERLREALQKSKDLIDEKLITDAWLIINDALQQKDSE